MRIHLSLVDSSGKTLEEASFASSVITVGSYAAAMFMHAWLPTLEIRTDGHHASVHADGRGDSTQVRRLMRRNVIPLNDGSSLRVDLYPHPDAVPRRRGACPSCGDEMVERRSGSAYRSIAKTERACPACGAVVLSLRGARELHGHFSDRSAHEVVSVMVASRCPQCLESMSRARYVFGEGDIDVERCVECQLVVLDRADQARLGTSGA